MNRLLLALALAGCAGAPAAPAAPTAAPAAPSAEVHACAPHTRVIVPAHLQPNAVGR